jgi:hypothetical protein
LLANLNREPANFSIMRHKSVFAHVRPRSGQFSRAGGADDFGGPVRERTGR